MNRQRRLLWGALAVAAAFHWLFATIDAHAASHRKTGADHARSARAHAPRHHSAKPHAVHKRRPTTANARRHHTKTASRPHHTKSASRHAAKRQAATHAKTRHAARSQRHHVAAADKPMIVIDPGHGGRDPGAIGRSGTLEKNVTLATALELKRQLLATGKYRVALTRTGDKFVSLAGRVAFARKHDADLFIAIHADSSTNHKAHGASVYTRTDDSGGTRTARVAATPGNSPAIASTIAKSDPAPPMGSASLQNTMIDNLEGDIRMVVEPSRQAKFYVLRARRIPSVLLEMGFLSNRRDEALLKRPKHRSVIARSLRDAINDYFAHLQRT
ncbi:MAG: N-acetylmuramoyl-L-alanine amidase [Alphaproteobacteria bacterium]|nr:N-acetylmuramoyl-L-alanine amidase [Alphaproteobacteria bacterium]